jgi:hypothetical protein
MWPESGTQRMEVIADGRRTPGAPFALSNASIVLAFKFSIQ